MLSSTTSPRPAHGGGRNRRPALALTLTALAVCTLVTGCGATHATSPAAIASPSPSNRPLKDAEPTRKASPSSSALAGSAQDQDFQTVLASKDDVTVYTPVHVGTKLNIPVLIKNTGTERAHYTVAIRVEGPGGFDTTVRMSTDVVGVYPGGTWPTELNATDHTKPVPQHPEVTIMNVARRPLFKE
ncbi:MULTISPECIES: hypothetical protein [Streptomyces]|uniref:Lipoprotein n=1 Tax=Streptomyces xanthochromogenes TaxID=67384 RepID=A0ABQ3AMH4_9ACTN|nr:MULTISPECIES: hypothetical protein [Streptomyces]MYV90610.1 hypothetical protein [Streptomyces sp. SID1034]GGY61916.1 hypothetical protein GCM10010326_65970 [Streptomyces xanthochromogenes]